MRYLPRRNILIAGGATLASVHLPRKPAAQTILTPREAAPVHLLGMAALREAETPVALVAQPFADAEDRPVTLTDFLGKGVVLNLWATWCVPCVAELPALDALSQRLADAGIVVVPISSDRGGAVVVRRFYAAHAIEHLGIWLDPKGVAARGWGARGLPTTLIIDREGRERARLEGGAEWASDAAIDAIRRLTS